MPKYNLVLEGAGKVEYRTIEADSFNIETVGNAPAGIQYYVFTTDTKPVACIPVARIVSMIDQVAER